MDTAIRRRIAGNPVTFGPYRQAELLYIVEEGMEPDDLWGLLTFLLRVSASGQASVDHQMIDTIRTLALRYQPRGGPQASRKGS